MAITEDITWGNIEGLGLPYHIYSNVTVSSGATLTIEAGTVIKFWGPMQDLIVDGRLTARGTESQSIVFTSLRDDEHGGDTNGDGSTTGPNAGNWSSITFTPNSTGSVLENTWTGYGGYGSVLYGYAIFHIYTDTVTISDSTIGWSYRRGIYASGASPTVERNTIFGHETGIQTDAGALPLLRENAITGNSLYGVQNLGLR